MKTYRLYVPASGARTGIRPESAIVGTLEGDGIHVHYQDGAADNIRTLEDRIHHAAGRMSTRYPTSSQAWFKPDQLVDVGEVRYDETLRHWIISDVERMDDLKAWAPGDHHAGGSPDLRRRIAGLRYGELTGDERIRLDVDMRAGVATPEDVLTILSGRTQAGNKAMRGR